VALGKGAFAGWALPSGLYRELALPRGKQPLPRGLGLSAEASNPVVYAISVIGNLHIQ
jgi:hypothetical protein